MDRDLRDILGRDQFDAERREARRLANALAGDVIAYRDALKGAGIPDPLRATLVEQFNTRWLGPVSSDAEIDFSFILGDEE